MAALPRSRRSSKMPAAASGDDRISGLPDEVLHRVLSLLPAREAVQTSVLARRWRGLWKSNRRLNVIYPWRSMPVSRSEKLVSLLAQRCRHRSHSHRRRPSNLSRLLRVAGDENLVAVDRLNRFVNRLLLLRDPLPLDKCEFRFDGFPRVDGAEVDVWIRHVLALQVPVLVACLGTNVHTALADRPLFSTHLKILELSEVKLSGGFLDFSSCTALVYVKMYACIVSVDRIFSPSLKLLVISRCNFSFDSRTCITVPSLYSLVLVDCEGQTPLLQSMPLLKRASVKLGWFVEDNCGKGTDEDNCDEDADHYHSSESSNGTDDDNCGGGTNEDCQNLCRICCGVCANCRGNNDSRICVLLGGLSSVTYLTLNPSYLMYTIKRDLQCCPMFRNLRTLILHDWRLNNMQALLCFLQLTPLLQKLDVTVPKEHYTYHVDKKLNDQIKCCLRLPNLRVVRIAYRKFGQRVCIWELMEILESCGPNLEQINILRDVS